MPAILPDQLAPGHRVEGLRGIRLTTGGTGDIAVADGRIVAGAVSADGAPGVVDADGWLLLPPLADLHAHLDKSYTWTAMGQPAGSLDDAIRCWAANSEAHGYAQIRANARRHLVSALRSGVTAVRSHANYHEGDDPLRGIRALIELREEFRGLVDLQVVAMHSWERPDGLVRDAIALGVDLLGAAPHLAPDPLQELERSLGLAEEAGLGVDLHTDENLDPDSLGIVDLAHRTRDWPEGMTRSAGHCVSLAVQPHDRLSTALDAAAAAGVSIVTNPLTNLYLQGWEHPVSTPRALPPLERILDAGIELAAGGDNVQDPFNPLGNGDMVDVVAAMVLAGHLAPQRAWDVAAAGGRRVMGLPPARGRVGDVADGILVRATSVAEAIAERAVDRVVLRGGRVVSVRRTTFATVDPVRG